APGVLPFSFTLRAEDAGDFSALVADDPARRPARSRLCPARGPDLRTPTLRGNAVAQHRPAAWRPREVDHRRPEPAERVLYRFRQRRRVEDERLRTNVDADLR